MIYILILIGFSLLIYGGNVLVDGAVAVARRLKVSPLLIGLTLVGFGTSTPELMTSLFAAVMNKEGIAVGNVVGSNIANILLVLGVAAAMSPIAVHRASFKRDSLFLLLSTGVLVLALLCGRIGFLLGAVMCATLGYYVYYSYRTERKYGAKSAKAEEACALPSTKAGSLGWPVLKTVLGLVLTIVGARMLVINSVVLAERWGVSETIIGLTLVALGTSLPELVTSIVASLKKQNSLVLGNVIGSNIYNALFILGVTALFVPVEVPSNIATNLTIMIFITGLLVYLGYQNKLTKRVGCLFCALYILYVIYLACCS